MKRREIGLAGAGTAECVSRILTEFDSLEDDEILVVTGDSDLPQLLEAFRQKRLRSFLWAPAERDHLAWTVEIARRGKAPSTYREVKEHLLWEHDRLDGFLRRVRLAAQDKAWEAAEKTYHAFHWGLLRHLKIEEGVLFPVLGEKTGDAWIEQGEILRKEHASLGNLLEITGDAISARSEADAIAELEKLQEALSRHRDREETTVYPMIDDALGEKKADNMVSRLQGL